MCSLLRRSRREYTQHEGVTLEPELERLLATLFSKMDLDGDGKIIKEEAQNFWGSNFAKASATLIYEHL